MDRSELADVLTDTEARYNVTKQFRMSDIRDEFIDVLRNTVFEFCDMLAEAEEDD